MESEQKYHFESLDRRELRGVGLSVLRSSYSPQYASSSIISPKEAKELMRAAILGAVLEVSHTRWIRLLTWLPINGSLRMSDADGRSEGVLFSVLEILKNVFKFDSIWDISFLPRCPNLKKYLRLFEIINLEYQIIDSLFFFSGKRNRKIHL